MTDALGCRYCTSRFYTEWECKEHMSECKKRPTPAAPVSPDATGKCGELETVRIEYRWGGDPKWKPFGPIFNDEPRETRELVTRSQAVELLAAERKNTAEAIREGLKAVAEVRADNAAKDARIKGLEHALTEKRRDRIGDSEKAGGFLCRAEKAEAKVEALEAKLERFRTDRAYTVGFTDGHDAAEAKLAAAEKALKASRPYVEDNDTRRHNTGVDETLTQIDAALEGKPS